MFLFSVLPFFLTFSPTYFNATSASFNITAPILGVAQSETDLTVHYNSSFSASFYLVDAVSNLPISNPSYKVYF
jgi:hypothetical protein